MMARELSLDVNQRGASAGDDIVGRDKNTTIIIEPAPRNTRVVEQLLQKLRVEIEQNEEVRHRIESLQYFYERRSKDGIVGLEAKLGAADRDHEIYLALEKKEPFVKLLEKWSLYASAQEIFAYLLAKVEHEFSMFVYPKIPYLDEYAINELVNQRIVLPTIEECGSDVFVLNHGIVMGMVYWLAEQCFLRWHQ
jgi:hypothetical protein